LALSTIPQWTGSPPEKNTMLHVPRSILTKITGFNIRAGEEDAIYALKKRQRTKAREIDLLKYFDKDMDMTFEEYEKWLVEIWIIELSEAFDIAKPKESDLFVEVILKMRRMMQVVQTNRLKLIYYVLKDFSFFRRNSEYWNSLVHEEKMIMMVPFFTTIDTCMINMITKNKPQKISEMFQNTPIKYVPMQCDENMVICEIVPNDQDNPGNSVFGPRGVICPGNIVTSMLVKTMMDLMNNLDYEVIGTPRFNAEGAISRIENTGEN